MRFRILGPLEVADDQGQPLAMGGRKQRTVLAILLLHANEVVSSDRLVEHLWASEPPASAAKSLQVYVSRLRRALGQAGPGSEQRLLTAGSGYLLRVAADELDGERFERLIEEGHASIASGGWELAAAKFHEVLELWRGQPLSDFEYESFAQAEIARLSELHVVAVEQRIAAELALGREGQVIGELEGLIREHPYRERLRGQLMLALYRTGRQAEALEAYRDARSVLVDELGIEPSAELRELQEAVLAQAASLVGTPAHAPRTGSADLFDDGAAVPPRNASLGPTNLPPQTRALVGRERERAKLRALLSTGLRAIVTITGIGGVGKTRLAMAVAADLLEQAPGGVLLVRLAGIHDPDSILPMIADAVGIAGETDEPLESAVARRLGERRAILILDNFEQLVAHPSIVADLAANAQHLRLLITSQVPLRISAEQIFALGPLASEEAAGLFIERARARVGDFEPTDDERAAIDDICARLDCVPLAIELAAARVGSLGPLALASRVERPLALLTRGERDLPARQRSLRAAIDWTYALLDRTQQSLFERLGVCSGPVPLVTVEAIADPDQHDPPLDQLDSLLECSLVRRQEDRRHGIRFFMPQALRDYALERLAAAGLEQSTRRQHAEHVAGLAHAARLWKWGATAEQQTALLAASQEIRPAIAWAREHDRELHARLSAALAPYWVYTGVVREVGEELRRAFDSGLGSAADRAWTTTFLAKCLQLEGSHGTALELAERALADWQGVEDKQEYAFGTGDLTWVYRWALRLDKALALTEEGLAILRRTQDRRLILRDLVFLAHVLVDLKDLARAQHVLEEAGELAGEDPSWELDAIRGDCAFFSGDYIEAIRFHVKSLVWTSQSGESHQILVDMRALEVSLARAGHGEAALELSELARLHERQTGRLGVSPELIEELERAISHSHELLGIDAAHAAIARARRVPPSLRIHRALQLGAQAADIATPTH